MSYQGTVEPGKIVVWARYKPKFFMGKSIRERYGKLQVIFTRQRWTHISLGFFPFIGHVEQTLFESNEIQASTLFDIHDISEYEIYKIKWYTQAEIESALWKTFTEYNGSVYGFMQTIYFVRRYIWETKWIKKYFWWIPTKVLH